MLCFSQRDNNIDWTNVNTAITLNTQIMMDGGDARLECNAIFDRAVVFAPFTGNTGCFDFKIWGLFVNRHST